MNQRLAACPQGEETPPLSAFAPALLLRGETLTNALLRETVDAIIVEADGQVTVHLSSFADQTVPNPHNHT